MKTISYLTGHLADMFWPAVVTGVAVAVMCAILSILVVLKRLAFIGQGVSHAAFGGVGLAALLGLMAGAAGATLGPSLAQFLVILAVCLAAALGVGFLSRRGSTQADTAIGIVLVASMALGAVLLNLAHRWKRVSGVSWESVLFGQLLNVGWSDAAIAIAVAALTLGLLAYFRRPMLFWAFDPPVARAFGVRADAMNFLLLTLLALATVTAMKLAGVVLATAMLVLPGAAALQLSRRSSRVIALSFAAAFAGVLGGLVLSFEADWPPGPSIVLVLTGLFAASRLARRAA